MADSSYQVLDDTLELLKDKEDSNQIQDTIPLNREITKSVSPKLKKKKISKFKKRT